MNNVIQMLCDWKKCCFKAFDSNTCWHFWSVVNTTLRSGTWGLHRRRLRRWRWKMGNIWNPTLCKQTQAVAADMTKIGTEGRGDVGTKYSDYHILYNWKVHVYASVHKFHICKPSLLSAMSFTIEVTNSHCSAMYANGGVDSERGWRTLNIRTKKKEGANSCSQREREGWDWCSCLPFFLLLACLIAP